MISQSNERQNAQSSPCGCCRCSSTSTILSSIGIGPFRPNISPSSSCLLFSSTGAKSSFVFDCAGLSREHFIEVIAVDGPLDEFEEEAVCRVAIFCVGCAFLPPPWIAFTALIIWRASIIGDWVDGPKLSIADAQPCERPAVTFEGNGLG